MVRRVAVISVLLSLALSTGPAALVPRAAAQDRPAPPSDQRDPSQRRGRWDRSRGDRGPDDGRGGRRWSRRDGSTDNGADRGPSRPAPSGPSTPSPSATTTDSSSSGPDVRGYARSLIAQHDKNGDMMLKGDELAGLRPPASGADLNGDGVITVDELVMHLSAPKASGSAATSHAATSSDTKKPDERVVFGQNPHWQSSASSASSASQGKAEKITSDGRKSYRFRSPKDRLPSGLPSFFSRDANGDGQISMSEYSRHWSDRMVAEFRRYDRDNDGMITPEECLPR